jgi:hypothetical protein
LTNDAGHLVLNKYDISLVPVVDGEYTDAGFKAVELIKQHFIILCPDTYALLFSISSLGATMLTLPSPRQYSIIILIKLFPTPGMD